MMRELYEMFGITLTPAIVKKEEPTIDQKIAAAGWVGPKKNAGKYGNNTCVVFRYVKSKDGIVKEATPVVELTVLKDDKSVKQFMFFPQSSVGIRLEDIELFVAKMKEMPNES